MKLFHFPEGCAILVQHCQKCSEDRVLRVIFVALAQSCILFRQTAFIYQQGQWLLLSNKTELVKGLIVCCMQGKSYTYALNLKLKMQWVRTKSDERGDMKDCDETEEKLLLYAMRMQKCDRLQKWYGYLCFTKIEWILSFKLALGAVVVINSSCDWNEFYEKRRHFLEAAQYSKNIQFVRIINFTT